MRTTTAFDASFEFVVWTIPSLYVSAVWSLHLPLMNACKTFHSTAAWLGIGLVDNGQIDGEIEDLHPVPR